MADRVNRFLEKLFSGLNMSWRNVVIFAVVAGVYTGLINSLPFLDFLQDTSFTDIAATYEWWILFAVIIASNCKKPLECGFKVFAFFLVSQPLVFLAEVPFKGWGIFVHYPHWFDITLFTLPGAVIAYFGTHKDNIFGTLVMCIAMGMLSSYLADVVTVTPEELPRFHILTFLFILVQIIMYLVWFIKKPRLRAFAIVFNVAVCVSFCCIKLNTESNDVISLSQIETWESYEIEDGGKYRIELAGNEVMLHYRPRAKETQLTLFTQENEALKFRLYYNEERILKYEMIDSSLEISKDNLSFIKDHADELTWTDFDVFTRVGTNDGEDLAVYKAAGQYELILSGRNGDLIENIYLKSVKTNEQIDLRKDDADAFLEQ